MIERPRTPQPRTSVPPQFALRVAILGGFALVTFAIIFFRLWYLQVLTGEQYVQQANANHERQLPILAPRGEILDRENQSLATSAVTNAVQIVPSEMPAVLSEQTADYELSLRKARERELPLEQRLKSLQSKILAAHKKATPAQRAEIARLRHRVENPPPVPVPKLPSSAVTVRSLFSRLGRVIGLSPRTIDERVVQGMTATPYANVTVKTDAGRDILTVLAERQNEFPGVKQEEVTIREYPKGDLAAQPLGYVGKVNETELKSPAFRGVKQDAVVGQSGLEYRYDRYLRGEPGTQRVEVNAAGEPIPVQLAPVESKAGYN
ncbi:MAG: hypothetical protein ACRDK2_04160, partial [Solirubrobacteraceae bacterium]